METIGKKSFFSRIPSWGLSLLTAILAFLFLFFFASVLGKIQGIGEDMGGIFAYIVHGILIAIACFYICKKYPKSIWYVPIICNIMGIISAIVEPNFWTTSMWIAICGGWFWSVVASYAGFVKGRSNITS